MPGKVDRKTVRLGLAKQIKVDSGGVNKNDGRVRIFVKDKFPGAHTSGFALRSRVVWWLNTGEVVKPGVDVHHKNQDRADDRFRNLEKQAHGAHARHHNPKGLKLVECVCSHCGEVFQIDNYRVNAGRGKFCSQDCFQAHPKSKIRMTLSCLECGKLFQVTRARATQRLFCSHSCANTYNWAKRR